eukprot:SAG31_NODE_3191_length_4571_cov_2.395572_2_plen_256_part_01
MLLRDWDKSSQYVESSCETGDSFSVLDALETYRRFGSGGFELKLSWSWSGYNGGVPVVDHPPPLIWKQTSNPVTDSNCSSDASIVCGYEAWDSSSAPGIDHSPADWASGGNTLHGFHQLPGGWGGLRSTAFSKGGQLTSPGSEFGVPLCSPLTQTACEKAAIAGGLKLGTGVHAFSSDYSSDASFGGMRGCIAFAAGHSQFAHTAFFSTGGTEAQNAATIPDGLIHLYRPVDHDCANTFPQDGSTLTCYGIAPAGD